MKLILSTSNIMGGGPSVIRRPTFEKSNTELTSSLRVNFTAHQASPQTNGSTPKPSHRTWTSQSPDSQTLYIPALNTNNTGLSEPRSQYDITVKLFYLPNIPSSRRCIQTREAIDLVLKELHVDSIDLLIVSFPGISFDADDEDSDEDSPPTTTSPPTTSSSTSNCDDSESGVESIDSMLKTWYSLEKLQTEGIIGKLGVAEFGVQRLSQFLPRTQVKPSVNQINVRDCCVVPKPLILFAKKEGIELLTHNDCTNVLPRGTVRELLGSEGDGAGVLAGTGTDGTVHEDALKGDVEPQWVVKYTAVVKDRGVVESKGYFATAELKEV